MKEKIFLILTINIFLFSFSNAGKCYDHHIKKQHKLDYKKQENYKQKIDKRIQNAIESGLITKEQGDALLIQKKELEDYKKIVWQDDVMTKEEKDKLDTMRKDFKEKMHSVLETAIKKWETKRHDTSFQRDIIQKALRDNKITKSQANSLLKKIDNLEKLEKQIWADNKMTKQEHEQLQQTKFLVKQDMQKLFKKSVMKKPHKCPYNEYCPSMLHDSPPPIEKESME